ncbi:MAG: trypsin-like serine protease, partial [Myxococcota bacterium]
MRVLLLCAVVGCTVDTASSVRSAIVDGTPAPEEEAVVLVKVVGGIGQCSGTFISPSVVLTAKHCVQAERMPIPHANSVLSIGVGSAFGDTVDYRVRRVDTTPGAYSSGLTGLVGEDVGVITILPDRDGNFPDVDPIGVYRESPVDLVGQDVTFIGYGRQPSGVSGRKMKTTGAITSIQGNVIISRQNICQGDSGGPMVLEGSPREIVGVASFGRSTAPGATCPSAEDGHNRVDVLLGMIDEALLEAGDCPVMEEEICDSIDNNCDGVIDEGCKGLGEACEADNECAFAQLPERFGRGLRGLLENPVTCGDTPSGRVCTRRCDP